MHIAAIDYMANSGNSFLHRARPAVKVIVSLLLLIALILTNDIYKAVLLIAVPVFLLLLSKSNLKEILHLAAYPMVFSLIFALIRVQESWLAGLMVLLRALGAALNMLFLIATTPYTDIFRVFSYVLPGVIIDIFLFSYRSLFILLDKLSSMIRSIKLRGGFHPAKILFNLKNIAGMLGVLIIHAFDMSERLYRIYSLRGYSGKIPMTKSAAVAFGVSAKQNALLNTLLIDILLLLFSLIVLIGVLIPWKI
jgi:cobalt/nickel transport system permease protein